MEDNRWTLPFFTIQPAPRFGVELPPAILTGIIVALLSTLLIGLPIIGVVFGLSIAVIIVLNIVGLLAGGLIGALIFG